MQSICSNDILCSTSNISLQILTLTFNELKYNWKRFLQLCKFSILRLFYWHFNDIIFTGHFWTSLYPRRLRSAFYVAPVTDIRTRTVTPWVGVALTDTCLLCTSSVKGWDMYVSVFVIYCSVALWIFAGIILKKGFSNHHSFMGS